MKSPETFYVEPGEFLDAPESSPIGRHFRRDFDGRDATAHAASLTGWYWTSASFPDLHGPFPTEDDAKRSGGEAVATVPAGSLDLTPTWSALLPLLIDAAAAGGREANKELRRLAGFADRLQPALNNVLSLVRDAKAEITAGKNTSACQKLDCIIATLRAATSEESSNDQPLPTQGKSAGKATSR